MPVEQKYITLLCYIHEWELFRVTHGDINSRNESETPTYEIL